MTFTWKTKYFYHYDGIGRSGDLGLSAKLAEVHVWLVDDFELQQVAARFYAEGAELCGHDPQVCAG